MPSILLDRATGVIAFELQTSYRIAASSNRRLYTPLFELHILTQTQWRTGMDAFRLIQSTRANVFSWAPFIGLFITVVVCAAAWILAPKGENQTYVSLRYALRGSGPSTSTKNDVSRYSASITASKRRVCPESSSDGGHLIPDPMKMTPATSSSTWRLVWPLLLFLTPRHLDQ